MTCSGTMHDGCAHRCDTCSPLQRRWPFDAHKRSPNIISLFIPNPDIWMYPLRFVGFNTESLHGPRWSYLRVDSNCLAALPPSEIDSVHYMLFGRFAVGTPEVDSWLSFHILGVSEMYPICSTLAGYLMSLVVAFESELKVSR